MHKAVRWMPVIVCIATLQACATTPLSLDHQTLSVAREAIEEARAANAEECAPELMAMAQSRLYWAAHELDEEHRSSQYSHEARGLIVQAEAYARKARAAAIKNCAGLTTVILMPDEDGGIGVVSVQADGATRSIDQPFHYTRVSGRAAEPEPARVMDEAQFNRRFADLLGAQPLRPAHFMLYFISGTSELTEASKALLPEVLDAAKKRRPAEVSIIGHTDATGSQAINLKISKARAEAVEYLLKASEAPPESIYLRFHGENDPLVPTPDNVPEPRNRRVEIMIL